jgi:hypothetical protein
MLFARACARSCLYTRISTEQKFISSISAVFADIYVILTIIFWILSILTSI